MRKLTFPLFLLFATGAGLSASAQTAAVQAQRPLPPAVASHTAHLPYTAELKTTRVQTLGDGSTVTHETTEVLARDSQGRTLNSSSGTALGDDAREYTNVNINDPVGKTHTFWSTPGQRVFVTNNGDAGTPPPSCSAGVHAMIQPASGRSEKPKMEDLGVQTFEGVEAHGHRTTWTYAPGQIGNSDLLVHTSEVWFSTTPGLEGVNVRQVNDDPRSGKETRELVKFTPGEPDASLFTPPQDFVVEIHDVHNEVRCP